jgi:hypothetical protein
MDLAERTAFPTYQSILDTMQHHQMWNVFNGSMCYIGPVIEPVGGTVALQLSTVKVL